MNNIENLVRDTLYDLEQESVEAPADLADRVLRVRRRRPARLVAAVSAAVVAALLIGTQALSGGGEQGASTAAQPPSYVWEMGSARQVLLTAGGVVANDPVPTPLAGQWTYRKKLEVRVQEDGPGEERGGPRETEHWNRYADPAFENGNAGDDHSPRERFRFLAALPADPAKVKAAARTFYPSAGSAESRTQHDFRALSLLAMSSPADPRGLAKVYRAMATVPGLQAVQTMDAAGRDAIGICLPDSKSPTMRELLLLDPATYRYSGSGSMKKTGDGWVTVPAGSVALLATGMVGKDGVRP
ncbi:CU044_5270 family protein [Streptomyces beijiangensis]|uniref:CU044_5270 family protein n=1 Tax=Streptomyces beijiangensis TaxID=163361 RepID=A0A939F858_9ACTN|nr:CU044_5270 family protein [Streptomyces beijiangensis]MBO0514371.1 CU044_5270 family protein [Streptomyces beijiangensis]